MTPDALKNAIDEIERIAGDRCYAATVRLKKGGKFTAEFIHPYDGAAGAQLRVNRDYGWFREDIRTIFVDPDAIAKIEPKYFW